MIIRIHILGASSLGTTTLAKTLANDLGYKHFDTDNYYWIPSEVPFTRIRPIEEWRSLLKKNLENMTAGLYQDHCADRYIYPAYPKPSIIYKDVNSARIFFDLLRAPKMTARQFKFRAKICKKN